MKCYVRVTSRQGRHLPLLCNARYTSHAFESKLPRISSAKCLKVLPPCHARSIHGVRLVVRRGQPDRVCEASLRRRQPAFGHRVVLTLGLHHVLGAPVTRLQLQDVAVRRAPLASIFGVRCVEIRAKLHFPTALIDLRHYLAKALPGCLLRECFNRVLGQGEYPNDGRYRSTEASDSPIKSRPR